MSVDTAQPERKIDWQAITLGFVAVGIVAAIMYGTGLEQKIASSF